MSIKVSSGIVLGTLVLLATSARAENPDHIRQLLQTNACENCDLSGADLSGLDLQAAQLRGANLSGAKLLGTQLMRADLANANLSRVTLGLTNFTGANLQATNLTNAVSDHLCEMESDSPAAIADCMAQWVQLKLGRELCADAYGLQAAFPEDELGLLCDSEEHGEGWFAYAYLYRPQYVEQLILRGANLQGARLDGADLIGADLRYADLSGAIATNTNLSYALLLDAKTADLQDADLTQAWLTPAALGDWLVDQYYQSAMAARSSEGQQYVGAMNRGQQAYHLEYGSFAGEMDDLLLGIEQETDNYRYGMLDGSTTSQFVMQYGLSKVEDLPSYIGFVRVSEELSGEPVTQAYLCESAIVAVMTEADLPTLTLTAAEPTCPEGWHPVD